MKKALVIEDDAAVRANICELLSEEGFELICAENGRTGLELARRELPSFILCDVRMPLLDGFGVLRALRDSPETVSIPFIFVSAAADRDDVRQGMNLGADDYLTKPFTRIELLEAVRCRIERRGAPTSTRSAGSSNRRVGSQSSTFSPPHGATSGTALADVIVCDDDMRSIYDQAAKAASASISVLILGETGVGKEILAQSIHELSPRRDRMFLALNCSALSETLLEGELFGSERGAFTGAESMRKGLFESAEGGTVFLDEVGEIPMSVQVKLLRVIEERRVLRVGGRTPIDVDVRFVAATNRDLEAEVARGVFREDLYFRLNGITLSIPPLRERTSEIVPLAHRFLANACAKLGRDTPTLTADAAALLTRYAWPGNIRELKNAIERAAVLTTGSLVDANDLPSKLGEVRANSVSPSPMIPAVSVMREQVTPPPASTPLLRNEMVALERRRIAEALDACRGNQTAAAEILGMARRTLVSRLGLYEMPRPRKRT